MWTRLLAMASCLRYALSRRRVDEEARREFEAHLELLADRYVRSGMTAQDARAAARRQFGSALAVREDIYEMNSLGWDRLMQDLRYSLRTFRRTPVFTATAVLSLALGIGGTTAIFTVINAAMLRTLPVSHPEQLALVREPRDGNFSYPEYVTLRDGTRALSDLIAASSLQRVAVGVGDDSELTSVKIVSGNYFAGLGLRPGLGRLFAAAEESEPVAVISRGYWRRQFDESAAVPGRQVRLNGVPFTIVGVAPADFSGEAPGESPDVWASMALQTPAQRNERGFSWLYLMGRLRPGATHEQAQAELTVLRARSRPESTAADGTVPRVEVTPGANGSSSLRERFSGPLRVLMATAGIVLLIACTNLASLLLARGAARQWEIAMRLAIGATRARIVRQLMTESLLLAAAGGVLGLAFAFWGSGSLVRLASVTGRTLVLDLRPDARVLLFSGAVSIVACVLFGLAPALRAVRNATGRLSVEGTYRVVGRERRWGLQDAFIVVQVALSLVLLAGSVMFIRTLKNLEAQDLGFRADGVLLVQVVRESGYRPALSTLIPRLLERLESIAGVEAATVAFGGTLANGGGINGIQVEGYTPRDPQDQRARADWVGPGYLRTAGITLVAGRDFSPVDDGNGQKVAIINQTMARHYFGDAAAALARRFTFNKTDYAIIGVAGDAKYSDLREPTPRVVYFPVLQGGGGVNFLEVRASTGDARALAGAVRSAIREVDPRLSAGDIATLSDRIARKLGREHLVADLTGFFGTLTLLLLSIGVYGTLAYAAGRRTKEIAVRLALGAPRAGVIWIVLREIAATVGAGIVLGTAGVLAVGPLVTSLLFGLRPTDPSTMAGAAALLIAVAVLAGYLPALAASRLDPASVLRE